MKTENTLAFQVNMDPAELRNMSGVLSGIADVVERNATPAPDTTVDTSNIDDDSGAPASDTTTTAAPAPEQTAAPAPTTTVDTNTAPETLKPTDYPIIVNGVEVDAAGLPWNAEIHGAGKDKIQKKSGLWKYKRGLDEATKLRVEAELRGVMGTTAAPAATSNVVDINVATTAPAPAPAPEQTAAPAPAPAPAPEVAEVVETLYITPDGGNYTHAQLEASGWDDIAIDALQTVGPVAQVTTEAPAATGDVTFPELMALVTPALANNTITMEKVTEV